MTKDINRGSAHWEAVPPQDDGTAADTDRYEVAPAGSGPGAIALIVLISFLVLGLAGVMVMISQHAGGGR